MPQGNADSSKQPGNHHVSIPQEYYAKDPDDEISLKEIWDILVAGKYIISGFVIVFFFVAIAYVFMTAPIYQVRGKLLVRTVDFRSDANKKKDLYYERLREMVLKYNSKNGVDVSHYIYGGIAYLNLTKNGLDPDDIFNSVDSVLNEILTDHKIFYEEKKILKINYIALIQRQLESTKLQLKEISNLKKRARDDIKVMILTEKRNLQIREVELDKELTEQKLDLMDMKPTVVLEKPFIPTKPIKPNKPKILSLAIILGLMGGVFAAFLMSLIAKFREAQS